MFKMLLVNLGVCISVALFKYYEIHTLVDVATYIMSGLMLAVNCFLLYCKGNIYVGGVLKEDVFKTLKGVKERSKIERLVKNCFIVPVIISTLIYISAPVSLTFYLMACGLHYFTMKAFREHRWTEDGYCIEKKS